MEPKPLNMETVITLSLIGLAAGILSGFVGLGGGVVLVPCLIYFLGMSQHMAQGTSLAVMLPPIGILAVINYYREGHVDMRSAALLSLAFIVGGYFGSKVAIALPAHVVKRAFGVIVLLVGIKMILNK
jgi:uncharacterized protein